jgi:hypothetical protein
MRRLVVDVGRGIDAEALQQAAQLVRVVAAAQAVQQRVGLRVDVVQAAAVGDEQMQPVAAVDQVDLRAQRGRQLEQVIRNPDPRR